MTQPPEKVTFSGEKMTFTFLKMTFSGEKMTFTILKVTFSDEKMTLFGNKVVFSEQFSREFNRKVYLLGKACQVSIAKDNLFLANGHLSAANYLFSDYTSGIVPLCTTYMV